MTGTELFNLARQKFTGNPRIFIADADYAIPKKNWLLNKFYPNFRQWLKSNNLDVWHEYNDCDDFATRYRTFSQMCHARSGRKIEEALAVGEMFYQIDNGGGGHAINCAVVLENQNPKIICIEPQTGQEIFLSESELRSCWFARF